MNIRECDDFDHGVQPNKNHVYKKPVIKRIPYFRVK
jgi:hypothetical protein